MRPPPLLGLIAAALVAGCGGDDGRARPPAALVETIAGAGFGDGLPATEVPVSPTAIAVDDLGNIVIGDQVARVRRIDAATGRIATIAGNGRAGLCGEGGPAEEACLGQPGSLAVDPRGNVYLTEVEGARLLRVDAETGRLDRVAGRLETPCSPDPIGRQASDVCFSFAGALTLDPPRALVYDGRRVLGIDLATGAVATVAGGASYAPPCPEGVPAPSTCLDPVAALADGPTGDLLVATPTSVLAVDAQTHILSRLTGRPLSDPCFVDVQDCPQLVGVAADGAGNVYAAGNVSGPDAPGGRVARLDPETGDFTTIWSTDAALSGLAADRGGALLVASTGPGGVTRVEPATGRAEPIAGSGSATGDCGDGGPANASCIGAAGDLAVDPSGNILFAESTGRVRRIDAATGVITTIAGAASDPASVVDPCDAAGPAASAHLSYVEHIGVDGAGNVFLTEFANALSQAPPCVVRIDAGTGTLSVAAGNAACPQPNGLVYPPPTDGIDARQACVNPVDIAVTRAGDLYIDEGTRIRRVDAATGRITTIAGDGQDFNPCDDVGPALSVSFLSYSMALDRAGDVFLTDFDYYCCGASVKRVDAATGIITTVVGGCANGSHAPGMASDVGLIDPDNVAIAPDGNLLVSDAGVVHRVDLATGMVSTVDGGPHLRCIPNDDGQRDFGCLGVGDVDADGRVLFFDRLGTGETGQYQYLVRRLTFGAAGSATSSTAAPSAH